MLNSLDELTLKWEQQTILEQHFFYPGVTWQKQTLHVFPRLPQTWPACCSSEPLIELNTTEIICYESKQDCTSLESYAANLAKLSFMLLKTLISDLLPFIQFK